jgi:hypothetical protein
LFLLNVEHYTSNIKAKELKKPFEETVLKVLGESSSHRQLWLELHPTDDDIDVVDGVGVVGDVVDVVGDVVDVVGSAGGVDSPRDKDDGLHIEANLKGKARAREKATLDYKGDLT